MDSVLESELEDEFGMFGIDINGNIAVLEKLVEICRKHVLTSSSVVGKWFTHNTSGQILTPDILDEFDRKLTVDGKSANIGKKKSAPIPPNTYDASVINSIMKNEDDDDDVIGGYCKDPISRDSVKRLHTTPEPSVNKRVASLNKTIPRPTFSPESMPSPMVTTPSLRYDSRSGKGDVVCCFGTSEKEHLNWKGCVEEVAISDVPDCNVPAQYRYMFQKLQDKASVLDEMIRSLADQMKQNLMLDEYEHVAAQTQEDITIAGRICCDAVGRLNSKSVLLEGSLDISLGEKVPIELSSTNNYSLFPGQIVAINGRNVSGSKFHASSIYNGTKLPFYSHSKKGLEINENHFSVYVACGPFATSDAESISYTPLEDFMDVVKKENPDVVIMLGPFVDTKHPWIQSGKMDLTFDELFSEICGKVTSTVANLRTQVIFVPSQRDVFHEWVYPQPPFSEEPTKLIKMVSDPATIMVNDVCIGMTSTDILFHLGGEEVASFTEKSDRLGRIANHLLQQQSYYPLYPTSSEVNVELDSFENYGFMPFTPDILLVPSDLRYFIKDLDGCLCVNPGRLVKGQTGGSYLKLLVKPNKSQNTRRSSVVERSIAQVIRI